MIPPVKSITENFLTDDERTSPVWQSVQRHLERMLTKARIENDNPKLTDVETATLRGRIQLLTAFLALGKKPPETTATVARPRSRPDYGAQYG